MGALYDSFRPVRFARPRLLPDGTVQCGTGSILDENEPVPRDVIPELPAALDSGSFADAVRMVVERTAVFTLLGSDELRGWFVDQLPGAGLIESESHRRQVEVLLELLFFGTRGIPERYSFWEASR